MNVPRLLEQPQELRAAHKTLVWNAGAFHLQTDHWRSARRREEVNSGAAAVGDVQPEVESTGIRIAAQDVKYSKSVNNPFVVLRNAG